MGSYSFLNKLYGKVYSIRYLLSEIKKKKNERKRILFYFFWRCLENYFRRCMMAALARPAFSIVCSESVSSLFGKVVSKVNVCAAYCGRALKCKIN